MLRINRMFTILLLLALILSACPSASLPSSAPPTGTPIPPTATPTPTPLPSRDAHMRADQIVSKALEGNLLNDPTTRRFYVLLPPNYFYNEKRYPVVYVLPWGAWRSRRWLLWI